MKQKLVIRSLPQAYEVIKGFGLDGEGDYRESARDALREILHGRMEDRVGAHLEEMERLGEPDRRNGYYIRHLLTELGDIELSVPRTRRMSAVGIVRAYARRVQQVDRMIMACFVLGLGR